MTSEAALEREYRLDPEDQARADLYALLARLFASAPDATLLAAIAAAPALTRESDADDASGFPADWNALCAASARTNAGAVADEFQALFIGVGKSEVSLYASHYLGPQSGRPLADLRAALADMELARRPESTEFEDHLSVELEIMRMLVAGADGRPSASIDAQRAFCERFLLPWAFACCTAISECPIANYYGKVAQLSRSFLALERDSFAIE